MHGVLFAHNLTAHPATVATVAGCSARIELLNRITRVRGLRSVDRRRQNADDNETVATKQ